MWLLRFFFFLGLFPAGASAGTLTCQKNPQEIFFLKNAEGLTIGSGGYSSEQECSQSAGSAGNNLVCSWNGAKYQIFNTQTGVGLGSNQWAYPSFQHCLSELSNLTVLPADLPAACAWTGTRYNVFRRADNLLLGSAETGWTTMKECAEAVLPTFNQMNGCVWDKGYYLVDLQGRKVSLPLSTVEECKAFQKRVRQDPQIMEKMAAELSKDGLFSAFRNGQPDEGVGFKQWKDCAVKDENFHLSKVDANHYIVPECSPDTLYSWGSFEKLNWFVENLKDGALWPRRLPRTLFTTHSAAATFGYGQIPMRFKLKPGVKIRRAFGWQADQCSKYVARGFLSEADLDNTLIARVDVRSNGFSLMEYLICSPSVIESWSYGTEEHFDEIVRDHVWMSTQDPSEWEGYTKQGNKKDYLNSRTDAQAPYLTDFKPETLGQRLRQLRALIQYSPGQIFLSGNASTNWLRESHFLTTRPTHFNPK